MHDDHDTYGHDHDLGSELSPVELRVRALETILVEKGYVEAAALDASSRLRNQDRSAYRRAGRRQGLERSGLQAGAAR